MVVAFNTVPAPFYALKVVTGAPYRRRPREVGEIFMPTFSSTNPRFSLGPGDLGQVQVRPMGFVGYHRHRTYPKPISTVESV